MQDVVEVHNHGYDYKYRQESCAIVKMSARCALAFLTDLHNPTICTWFAAFVPSSTVAGQYGQNNAKTAVSVAVEAKPEVEIWRQTKKSKERW